MRQCKWARVFVPFMLITHRPYHHVKEKFVALAKDVIVLGAEKMTFVNRFKKILLMWQELTHFMALAIN